MKSINFKRADFQFILFSKQLKGVEKYGQGHLLFDKKECFLTYIHVNVLAKIALQFACASISLSEDMRFS